MTAQQAFDKILALRELTAETHVQTYKTQTEILRSLSPDDLAEVALLLKSFKILSGGKPEAR